MVVVEKFRKMDANARGKKESRRCEGQRMDVLHQTVSELRYKFVLPVEVDEKNKFSAEIFFKQGPGVLQSIFGSDRKYWSQRIKTALGLNHVAAFPYQ